MTSIEISAMQYLETGIFGSVLTGYYCLISEITITTYIYIYIYGEKNIVLVFVPRVDYDK